MGKLAKVVGLRIVATGVHTDAGGARTDAVQTAGELILRKFDVSVRVRLFFDTTHRLFLFGVLY